MDDKLQDLHEQPTAEDQEDQDTSRRDFLAGLG